MSSGVRLTELRGRGQLAASAVLAPLSGCKDTAERGGEGGGDPRSKSGRLATYGSRRASSAGARLKIDPASQLAKARPLIPFHRPLI